MALISADVCACLCVKCARVSGWEEGECSGQRGGRAGLLTTRERERITSPPCWISGCSQRQDQRQQQQPVRQHVDRERPAGRGAVSPGPADRGGSGLRPGSRTGSEAGNSLRGRVSLRQQLSEKLLRSFLERVRLLRALGSDLDTFPEARH